jgi:hypothetical protein
MFPTEIWVILLSQVALGDIFNTRLVCKRLLQISRSKALVSLFINRINAKQALIYRENNYFPTLIEYARRRIRDASILLNDISRANSTLIIYGGFVRDRIAGDSEFNDIDVQTRGSLLRSLTHFKNYTIKTIVSELYSDCLVREKCIITHPEFVLPIYVDNTGLPGGVKNADFSVNSLYINNDNRQPIDLYDILNNNIRCFNRVWDTLSKIMIPNPPCGVQEILSHGEIPIEHCKKRILHHTKKLAEREQFREDKLIRIGYSNPLAG